MRVFRRQELGFEGGIGGFGREGEVEFGGAAAEERGGVEVEAGVVVGFRTGRGQGVRKVAGWPSSVGVDEPATDS